MADSKVLLITGASSGIGAETAREAVKSGWKVALAARREEKLQALSDELGGLGKALPVVCDVTSWDAQKSMVAKTINYFGGMDAVFANAGIVGIPGGYSDSDPEQWKEMVLTNVYGVGLTLRASLEELKRKKGHVLITSSAAARLTIPGSMYCATKWAVSAIGSTLREELKGTGVRSTVIEPGMVDTRFADHPRPNCLNVKDIARTVMFALSQPPSVNVHVMTTYPIHSDF
ncbi:short-chain dehydrogenase [Candidatus Endobugula sertula]|uniref:Short-chain dehydrogenase n=1 Tax=Candidatus Endobugula sertula TaxID=62101 RepID=A0A1D2QLK6_9GAMM|nr:short-chain dehydrogenase [Candidatus Endobugula sertula]